MARQAARIGMRRLTVTEKRIAALLYPERTYRPQTRGDCINGVRPCPFVSCRHHLALEVENRGESIRLDRPHEELWDRTAPSCSLDVVDENPDGLTHDEIGEILGVTRQRAEQEVSRAMQSFLKAMDASLGQLIDVEWWKVA